jgi:hypothetical protein
VPHILPRFQVHVHPDTPVSIVCAVSGDVISPQVHTQFHVQVVGSGELAPVPAADGDPDACAEGALPAAVPGVTDSPVCPADPVEPAGSG